MTKGEIYQSIGLIYDEFEGKLRSALEAMADEDLEVLAKEARVEDIQAASTYRSSAIRANFMAVRILRSRRPEVAAVLDAGQPWCVFHDCKLSACWEKFHA